MNDSTLHGYKGPPSCVLHPHPQRPPRTRLGRSDACRRVLQGKHLSCSNVRLPYGSAFYASSIIYYLTYYTRIIPDCIFPANSFLQEIGWKCAWINTPVSREDVHTGFCSANDPSGDSSCHNVRTIGLRTNSDFERPRGNRIQRKHAVVCSRLL